MELNKYQTPIEKLVYKRAIDDKIVNIPFLEAPKEVQEEFNEIIATVPMVQWLISKDRPNIKDLPKDEKGRAVWRIEYPPIIENTDYFRETAIHYQRTGRFTDLRPNGNPNSEYKKWVDRELDRIENGCLRPDGAWIPGYMYWFLNYCPIILTRKFEDAGDSEVGYRDVDFPEFWEGILWRYKGWDLARSLGLHFAEISKRGSSKAHPYCEKVITPEGEKLWKDIKVGDWLFGDDGIPTQVIDIPFDGEADIYKLTLRDGRTVLASDEHLWRLKVHNFKEEQIWSTNKIIQNYKRKRKISERNPAGIEHICGIPANKAIDLQEKETKVDPYTFGLLLGDGCFRHKCCYFTCETSDFEIISQSITYKYTKWKSKFAYRLHIDNWMKILKDYGLWYKKSEDKFIPDEYKYNSKKVRLSLLKGLMDSDGYLDSKNTYCISTTSEKLASDIRWLCWSLGYNTLITKQKAGYKVDGIYKECLPVYIITIHTYDAIATIPRKTKIGDWTSKYAKSHAEQTRITNIEYVGKMPAKCVTVNNQSQCYLIGDFIVTHNSYTLASALSKIFVIGDRLSINPKKKTSARGVLMAYQKEFLNKDGTLNKFEDMIDFVAQNTEFPRKRLKSSINEMDWVMGYTDLNTGAKKGTGNEVLGVAVKDDPDKGRGKRASLIGLEEFGKFPNVAAVIKIAEPSVKDGDLVFGLMLAVGTGGEEGCLTKNNIIMASDGRLLSPAEVTMQDKLVGYNIDTQEPEEQSIEHINIPKSKPCVKITTNSFRTLECSIDHPIYASTCYDTSEIRVWRWVQAGELKAGDLVAIAQEVPFFGNKTVFDPYLLGILIGDGSYITSPRVTSCDEEIHEYLRSNYKVRDYSTPYVTASGKTVHEYGIKGIRNELRALGIYGQSKMNKRIPNVVFECTKETISKVLAGLFDTDGCITISENKKGNRKPVCNIYFSASSLELIKQVQMLLQKLGVYGTILEKKPSNKKKRILDRNSYYSLLISSARNVIKFHQQISLGIKYKQEKLDRAAEISKTKKGWKKQLFEYETVKQIQFLGEQTVYNMSVGNCHTYLGNGIITHNSDFSGALDLIYHPSGSHFLSLENVWDKESQIRGTSIFCFPAYVNRKGCYNKDGISDVTKALYALCFERYIAKYENPDPMQVTRTKAENPVTLQDAIMKRDGAFFPVAQIAERLQEIDLNPNFFDNILVGDFTQSTSGKVEFKPTADTPIHKYNQKDNKIAGAFEIAKLPEYNREGKPYLGRYIAGLDPVDTDDANTMSFVSFFVLDLWTDSIVCEWTGRLTFVDDCYEKIRLACMFYNAKLLYENNKKGLFAYFKRMNCLYLLAETPEFLKDKDFIKGSKIGNSIYGVNATNPINNYARELLKNWMLKPVTLQTEDEDTPEVTIPNVMTMWNRAALDEARQWNPDGNFDRISALGMLMLIREDRIVTFGDNLRREETPINPILEDPFFKRNYRPRLKKQ